MAYIAASPGSSTRTRSLREVHAMIAGQLGDAD